MITAEDERMMRHTKIMGAMFSEVISVLKEIKEEIKSLKKETTPKPRRKRAAKK